MQEKETQKAPDGAGQPMTTAELTRDRDEWRRVAEQRAEEILAARIAQEETPFDDDARAAYEAQIDGPSKESMEYWSGLRSLTRQEFPELASGEPRAAPQEVAPSAREPRFTPGPWRIGEADASERPRTGRRIVVLDSDETEFILADCGGKNNVRALANAALIVAAPDLYEALRGALAWEAKTRGRLGLPQIDAPEWARAAQAALQKIDRGTP